MSAKTREVRGNIGGIKKQIAEIIERAWVQIMNFKSCVSELSPKYKNEMILMWAGKKRRVTELAIGNCSVLRKTRPRTDMGKRPANVKQCQQ